VHAVSVSTVNDTRALAFSLSNSKETVTLKLESSGAIAVSNAYRGTSRCSCFFSSVLAENWSDTNWTI
jgi:hypothetical protein